MNRNVEKRAQAWFGSSSRYRFVLYGVNVLLLVSIIVVMEWQHRSHDAAMERVDRHHLVTITSAVAIREQMHVVEAAVMDNAWEMPSLEGRSSDDSFLNVYPDARIALHLSDLELARIVDSQKFFHGGEVDALVAKIERQFFEFNTLLRSGGSTQNYGTLAQKKIAALNLSLEQLSRLHEYERAELMKLLPEQNRQRILVLLAIVGALVTVSYLAIRQVLRSNDQATEALRLESEIASNLSEGISLVRVDDGTIVYANRRMEEIFGYGPGEMTGMYVGKLNYEGEVDGRVTADEIISSVASDGSWSGEVHNVKKDGTPFWTYANTSVHENSQYGEVVVAAVSDITARRVAEAERAEFHARSSAIIEGSVDGIVTIDEDGLIESVNPAAVNLFGYTESELVGENVKILMPEPFSGEHDQYIQNYLRTGESKIFNTQRDLWGLRKDGTRFPIRLSVSEVKFGDRRLFTGAVQDITERKAAEDKIRESEQRLQDILDGIFAFVGVYTTDGVLIRANKAPLEAASLNPEDVLDKPFWDTYWWSYSEEVQDQLRDALGRAAKGETVRYDVPIRVGETEEGEPQLIVIDVTFGPLYDSEGEVTLLVGSAVDVTERKEAEKRLQRQADIIDQVHDSVISLDLSGIVTNWNKGAERIYGYPRIEAVGQHISFLYSAEKVDYLKDEIIGQLREEGTLVVDHNEVVNKSGEKFFVHLSLSLLKDENGIPIGIVGYSMDISERIESEEALRKSEASLSNAQRVAHVGNWDWNIVTNELYWSDEIFRIFGLEPQQFGATYDAFLETVHPEDRESVERAVNDAVNEGKEYEIDHRIVLPTKEVRTVHERGEVSYSSDGAPLRMIGTVQDITQRRVAELALEQSEHQLRVSLAEKEVLLKEMHHRVKNNLQIISSLLNLQSAQIEDEEVQGMFAESISRVSAMALIHEKLYRSGDLAQVDFTDYLESLVSIASETYAIMGQPVNFEVTEHDVYLDIDTAIPCALIVNELVSNALKHAFPEDRSHTNGSPEIRVELTSDGEDRIVLRVADNGCGFPDDVDFQKTESLGLQIVSTLARQLDGTIKLANENGTTFTVEFETSKQNTEV